MRPSHFAHRLPNRVRMSVCAPYRHRYCIASNLFSILIRFTFVEADWRVYRAHCVRITKKKFNRAPRGQKRKRCRSDNEKRHKKLEEISKKPKHFCVDSSAVNLFHQDWQTNCARRHSPVSIGYIERERRQFFVLLPKCNINIPQYFFHRNFWHLHIYLHPIHNTIDCFALRKKKVVLNTNSLYFSILVASITKDIFHCFCEKYCFIFVRFELIKYTRV